MKKKLQFFLNIVIAGSIVLYQFQAYGQEAKPCAQMKLLRTVGSDSEFIRIGSVATDNSGNIFVSDVLQFALKKFSPFGKFTTTYGERGAGPGQFGAYPSGILIARDTIYLVEQASPSIQLFTTKFRYLKKIECKLPIVDIAVDGAGRIFVNQIAHAGKPLVTIYSSSGEELGTIPFHPVQEGDAFQMLHLRFERHGRLILVHRFGNLVEVFDAKRNSMNQFMVKELPERSGIVDSKFKELGAIPDAVIIQDVGISREGYLCILAGERTSPPNRRVFVYTVSGESIGSFILPAPSGLLYLDNNGFLFTRERQRSILKQYAITFAGQIDHEKK